MEDPVADPSPNRFDGMNAASHGDAATRLLGMYEQLLSAYGPQHWWPAETAFEVVVGAYLTQNTAWRSVLLSLDNLRSVGVLSIQGLRSIGVEHLKVLIRPSGFYTRKAPALKAFIAMLDSEFSGSLDVMAYQPTDLLRRKLLSLPNVGPETADAILLYALKHPIPVADEYLRRMVERHRLIEPFPERNKAGYESLVQLTRQAFANQSLQYQEKYFNEFHALVVKVGKAHCGRKPDCGNCPLTNDLRYDLSNQSRIVQLVMPKSL